MKSLPFDCLRIGVEVYRTEEGDEKLKTFSLITIFTLMMSVLASLELISPKILRLHRMAWCQAGPESPISKHD